MVKCILIITCLITGFMLGRLGSEVYDGFFILGCKPGDHQIKLAFEDEDLPYFQYIRLKVVNEEEIEKD